VHPFGDDPLSWKKMPQWWLGTDPDGEVWVPYTLGVQGAWQGWHRCIFAEVPDRNGAEAVDGYYIAAPREALPKPDADEYYWGDLVGLEVRNASGVVLGKVTGLLSTGAHDVLQIQDGDAERLIPFVASYVTLSISTAAVSASNGKRTGDRAGGRKAYDVVTLFPEMFSALTAPALPGGPGSAVSMS
jgi:16S rRNA processing protein RimM